MFPKAGHTLCDIFNRCTWLQLKLHDKVAGCKSSQLTIYVLTLYDPMLLCDLTAHIVRPKSLVGLETVWFSQGI